MAQEMTPPDNRTKYDRRVEQARTFLFVGSYGRGTDPQADATVFEQYRLYLDLIDRSATRRSAVNSFFIAVNTAALAAIGFFWQDPPDVRLSRWWTIPPLFAVLVVCAVWYLLIAHYRAIGRAKWAIVAAFEERLPAAPFSKAEWQLLTNGGRDQKPWHRLTRLEQAVPVVFALVYLAGAAAILLTT